MKNPHTKLLNEEQFMEEFMIACKGLEHKYDWDILHISAHEVRGEKMMIFDIRNIGLPIAIPFIQFAAMLHDCFYTSGKTLCDELNRFLLFAKKEIHKRHLHELK